MFSIRYEEATEEDLKDLRPHELRRIFDEVDRQLKSMPLTPSRKRKVLASLVPPWDQVRPVWQLRIGDFRVFYDVDQEQREVIVRAVRRKGTKKTEEIL